VFTCACVVSSEVVSSAFACSFASASLVIEAYAREENIEEDPDYCFYLQAIEYIDYTIVSAYVSGGSMFIIMYDFD